MDLLLNDLSLHGQFRDIGEFSGAIERIMTMRQLAKRFGRELHCHRNVAHAQVTPDLSMPQAVQAISTEQRRALLQWLSRHGPFWEDVRLHSSDEYLECNAVVVTDTAIGEAAFGNIHGQERRLASITPSSWELSPLTVSWLPDAGTERTVAVINHWFPSDLEVALLAAPTIIASWDQLAEVCRRQSDRLTYSPDCFSHLRGHPFVEGAARQIFVLLDTLQQFKGCFDTNGQRTPEGQRLYQDHFTGSKGWFSDSSDAEKEEFKNELTFSHPEHREKSLFCPWHGKVKTPQIRIHFSWPVRANEPVYVVYVGPKITKR